MNEDIRYTQDMAKNASMSINTISDIVWHIRIYKSFTTNNKLLPPTNKSCTYKTN